MDYAANPSRLTLTSLTAVAHHVTADTRTVCVWSTPRPAHVAVRHVPSTAPLALSWQSASQIAHTRTWATHAILPVMLGGAATCAHTRAYLSTPPDAVHLRSETTVIDVVNLRAQQRREDGEWFGV